LNETSPEELKLSGPNRNFEFFSPFGKVRVRWQPKTASYIRDNPYQLVKKTWLMAAKTVSRLNLPINLKSKNYDWSLVFMDRAATLAAYPLKQIGCHPGWIKPPANIFVSIDFVVTRCQTSDVVVSPLKAQNTLQATLFHELGHALEFQLLAKAVGRSERYHNEGFATWFEYRALKDAGLAAEARQIEDNAKNAFYPTWDPKSFNGSNEDYARAFALQSVILEEYRGKIGDIYSYMSKNNSDYGTAVTKVLKFKPEDWSKKAQKRLR
jgi:hypothetical protein